MLSLRFPNSSEGQPTKPLPNYVDKLEINAKYCQLTLISTEVKDVKHLRKSTPLNIPRPASKLHFLPDLIEIPFFLCPPPPCPWHCYMCHLSMFALVSLFSLIYFLFSCLAKALPWQHACALIFFLALGKYYRKIGRCVTHFG